ncbi:hypothetical protein [Clostridium sp. JS66]|uniref:O-linked N-acetylglucosamine transferase family protein n=1 Tax=Clostridium sp. JS66 TaxID=3064705 RepID=UPI00298E3B32|nr:hypothetical protein [Clostridium sp. JS66]WPC41072.1 hypothetical protein Q6H37_24755 [Clostridium sp. JS66]
MEEVEILEKKLQQNSVDAKAIEKLAGIYLFDKKDWKKAIYWYKKLISIIPDYPYANYYMAECYLNLENIIMAREYFEKAMNLKEYSVSGFNNYAHLLSKIGENKKAIYYFKKAIEASDNKINIYSNLLLTFNYDFFLEDKELFLQHLNFGKLLGEKEIRFNSKNKNLDVNKKLKIGYVSSDFRKHSVMYFMAAPLVAQDKDNFEVYCYSDVLTEDNITASLKSIVNGWREISSIQDDEVKELILKDDIDILVDLNAHAGRNRLDVFAKRAAPIQVTWIGYPNTTGLKNMDYRITDNYADPEGLTDEYYSEKLIRMSKTFLCYSAAQCPDINKDIAAFRNKRITFGCFNNMAKITEDIIRIWCDILKKVDKSVLMLKNTAFLDDEIISYTKNRFLRYGVKEDQLNFIERDIKEKDHMNRYNDVDIALDTYPYNGTTTTCEAMYMGVPVITLAGKRHASRVGVSLLTNVGLSELIAYNEKEYIEKAVYLANDVENLKKIKLNLRNNMKESLLMQGDKFTRELEKMYRALWKNYCEDEKKQKLSELENYKQKAKKEIQKVIEEGKIEEAKLLINEYESIVKYDIEIYSMKSVIAIMEGKIDYAESVIKEGLDIDNEYYDLLCNMAYVQELKGNEELSIYYKKKSIQIGNNGG